MKNRSQAAKGAISHMGVVDEELLEELLDDKEEGRLRLAIAERDATDVM
jgi:hypothetical protein